MNDAHWSANSASAQYNQIKAIAFALVAKAIAQQ